MERNEKEEGEAADQASLGWRARGNEQRLQKRGPFLPRRFTSSSSSSSTECLRKRK